MNLIFIKGKREGIRTRQEECLVCAELKKVSAKKTGRSGANNIFGEVPHWAEMTKP